MAARSRSLQTAIERLALGAHKMAFISGPRQSGKTTLGKQLLTKRGAGEYYNWDETLFRRNWVKDPSALVRSKPSESTPLYVFDEIHKARNWKRTIKGIYDTSSPDCDIVVTGSARLNIYKKGGDSLLGRYLGFRMHPFSVGELHSSGKQASPQEFLSAVFDGGPTRARTPLAEHLTYGGFPEPFLRQSVEFSNLWRRGRVEKIIREDLRDLSRLPELSQVEMLAALLPERAGGMLSVQSLREDLEVAHDTAKRWLTYLKELYYVFELKPFSKSIARSLKKEGKIYLWDWSEVAEPGARFENLVASHLLKACHFWTDTGKGGFDLHYLRDKEKREVDFLITADRKPWLTIEAKAGNTALDPSFLAFSRHIGTTHHLQIVGAPSVWKAGESSGVRTLVASAGDVLLHLP